MLPVRFLIKDKYRSRDWIKDVEELVLIVHGTRDGIIPIRHGRILYKMANSPKQLIEIEDGDHLTATIQGLYPLIWDFIDHEGKPDGAF